MGKIGTPRYKDITGKIYGKLTVLEFSRTDKNNSYWKCLCECGQITEKRSSNLRTKQVKSCGKCDVHKKSTKNSVYKKHFNSIKSGAKSRELDFSLLYEEYIDIIMKNCFYCGSNGDVHYAYSRRRYSKGIEHDVSAKFNGLDRIDSNIGYKITNVVPCCFDCNRMKTDFDLQHFLEKVEKIYEHQKKISNNKKD